MKINFKILQRMISIYQTFFYGDNILKKYHFQEYNLFYKTNVSIISLRFHFLGKG